MSLLTVVYATDEDIAVRAPAEFARLCPRDQRLVWGTDGSFDPSDPWALKSNSFDFQICGIQTGQMVQLVNPQTLFPPPGVLFAVASVSAGQVRLRRLGQAEGVGQPPVASGLASGVEFIIGTLGPQIESASYDLDRRFGISDWVAGRQPSDLFDSRELREATVLTVLYRRYLDLSRQSDEAASKAARFKGELDELLGRMVVHWGASATGSSPPTTRFGTRISR